MKRSSVFLKVGVGFATVFLFWSLSFTFYDVNESYSRMTQKSFEDASVYLKIGRILLRDGEAIDLIDRLSEAVQARSIDYYLIRENGQDLAYSNKAGTDDPIQFPRDGQEGQYETDTYRYFLIKENSYELVVGHKTSRWSYFKRYLESDPEFFIGNFLVILMLTVALVFYCFRDLRSILARFVERNVKRSQFTAVHSKEAVQLIQGLKGYESAIDVLEYENSLLKGQVLPALQKELWSGRRPPYEFSCTMVRTDINNFTSIFSSDERAGFMEVINNFFIELTHIVSRYKGFVYEFIGDEVIFYFKDEDHSNSAAVAISAIRDINQLADQVSEKTEAERGYVFRIKSSVSHGLIHFGPLVNGFSLAGNPLIETVRILSHVHEKSVNTVLFDDQVRERISFLCTTKENKVVMLKGLAEVRRLHTYQAHVPLGHHLRQGTKTHAELVGYYRSDAHISETLEHIRRHYHEEDLEVSLWLLGLFRSYKVTRSSAEVRRSYLDLLEDLLPKSQLRSDSKEAYLLASTIAAGASLILPEEFKGRIREKVLESMKSQNRRVVANAIDLFSEMDPNACDEVFGDLSNHSDNRIAANTLVKEGKRDWNGRSAKRVRAMLRAKSAYYKASGLYALGEIAAYLRKEDEVAFHADRHLQGLLDEIVKLALHPNRMVRRQAMGAAKKANRIQDLYRIEMDSKLSVPVEIRGEIQVFLSQSEASDPRVAGARVAS